MNKNRLFLLVIGAFAATSFVMGLYETTRGNASVLTPLFYWIGVFTWDDGLMVGALLFGGSVYLWFRNNTTLTGLFFSAYVLVRAFIEALYTLNAQFSPITRIWEAHLPGIADYFNILLVEVFVIAQGMYEVITVITLMIFIYYLKKYLALKG